MDKQQLRRIDFLFSLVLIAFGVAILVAAYDMPWSSEQTGISGSWYLSPGLLPAILGAMLIVFSLNILAHAVSAGGHRNVGDLIKRGLVGVIKNRAFHKSILSIVVISVYIFGLLGNVNYYVATASYLFVFMVLFHHRSNSFLLNLLILGTIAIVVPVVVGYLFSNYLDVPLP